MYACHTVDPIYSYHWVRSLLLPLLPGSISLLINTDFLSSLLVICLFHSRECPASLSELICGAPTELLAVKKKTP